MATILDNIKNAFTPKPAEKKQAGNMVGYFGVGSSKSKQYTYAELAEEGYMRNSVVNRCVNEIAKGASAVPFMVKAGDQVLDSHPIINLMSRPNPLQSHSEFFNSIFGYLLLSGNAYILKVGSEVGAPKELHLLRPDRMVVKGGSNPIPDRYEYVLNGRVQAVYDVDDRTGASDVKHVKLFNPLDDFYGLSPMNAAAIGVDQHNLTGQHNINLLKNGARPSGAVRFKPQDDAGFAVNLTESQRQQVLSDLNNRFTGTANAGRPMLLEGDFDYIPMSITSKEGDFAQMKHMAATEIAMCFGVPSQLVGVPDAQTYANVAEARLALYEETIIPHLRKIESDLNEWLVPMFGENLEFCFDIDKIPALAERTKRIYENVTSAVREGIMTRNEAREAIGLSPIDGADDLYISATLFPITSDDVEEPQNPVAEEELDAYEEDEDMDLDFLEEDEKALADIDTKPTDSMATEAERGLNWRKEHNRGGTAVGVARANQLVSKENLSISTVKRMFSFFSRHEVDKQGQGFDVGEDGYPSAGRIAWALWGGDAGFAWSKRKVEQIKREEEKFLFIDNHIEVKLTESKAVSGAVKKGLQKKVDDHNDEYGDTTTKKTNLRTLTSVFERGVGAYRTNPSSVRPSVTSEEQWAYARVNSYLYALRNGRFRSGKHDTDLFPKGHPLSSK